MHFSPCQDGCGTYLASLCPEGDTGCAAQDGGYEVVLPEPIESGDGYRIRISEVGGDEVRCSDSFYLMGSEEGMSGTGASIRVVSPTSESVALAGDEYTVEVSTAEGPGAHRACSREYVSSSTRPATTALPVATNN